MQRRPARYRQTGAQPSKLSVALMLSILLHIALFVVPITLVYLLRRDPPQVFQVQLVQGAETGALRPDQAAPNPTQGPPPTEKPKGTPDAVPEEKPKEKPKPEEKKPEEKPKEKPKPEEKKPEEKPKEKPKPEEKKPEEKPKEKPKPEEKKPEEKPKEKTKEKPKAEDKKPEEKPKKKPVVLDDPDVGAADEEMEELDSVEPVDTGPVGIEDGMEGLEEVHVAKNVGELTQGSAVEAADFPDALSYWATLVKRKVDRAWHGKVPPGLSLDAAELKVRVGFWVNRNGEVIEDPVIVDGSLDTTLRASCIQAIKECLPLPPFPDTFTEAEQYITYVFTLSR
jgi:outer membrane biosynthesis protein TonB